MSPQWLPKGAFLADVLVWDANFTITRKQCLRRDCEIDETG
jgi:hypothetical protein